MLTKGDPATMLCEAGERKPNEAQTYREKAHVDTARAAQWASYCDPRKGSTLTVSSTAVGRFYSFIPSKTHFPLW